MNSISLMNTITPLHFAVINSNIEIVKMLLNKGANTNAKNQYGRTPLFDAIEYKRIEIIQLLLTHNAQVNTKDNKNISPLHVATENGDIEIVKMLLNKGANTNARNEWGRTPLYSAIENKGIEIIKLLLAYRANVNAKDYFNISPLHFAIGIGCLQITQYLLKHRAYVNHVCTLSGKEGYTPLHLAAIDGNKEIITLLLNEGANINVRGGDSKTPLYIASEQGYEDVVTLFLNSGADINATAIGGLTPLHIAIKRGHISVLKLLLQHGANVDKQDKQGQTVLNLAVEKGCITIIQEILKYFPSVNNKSNRRSLNIAVALDKEGIYKEILEALLVYGFRINLADASNSKLFVAAIKNENMKFVESLLKYGVNVKSLLNFTVEIGYTPLHIAAINKQEEIGKLLISYGANVNAQDNTGKTPLFYTVMNTDFEFVKLLLISRANVKDDPELLHIAVKNKSIEIVEALLQQGADFNASDIYGRTPLHFTALRETEGFFRFPTNDDPDINIEREIARQLLSKGANVDAQTKTGVTTLHVATENGLIKVVEILLEYNANVNCVMEHDLTPLHLATKNGFQKVIEILLKFGANVNSKDVDGRTALHIATKEGYITIVKLLLKYNANVNSRMIKYGFTPLHLIAENCFRRNHIKIVAALLDYGSDVNITCLSNKTPILHILSNFFTHFNHDNCSHQGFIIIRALKRHIIKLKAANVYVDKRNLQLIQIGTDMSKFENECEKEISSAKSEQIYNTNISIYDILVKDANTLARYMRNKNILHVLKSKQNRIKFPVYSNMIKCHFRKGIYKIELLKKSKEMFQLLSNNTLELPYNCTEKIFSYLSEEDLQIFINTDLPS